MSVVWSAYMDLSGFVGVCVFVCVFVCVLQGPTRLEIP